MNKLEIGVFFRQFSAKFPVKEQVFKDTIIENAPNQNYSIQGIIEKDVILPNGTIDLFDFIGVESTNISMLFIFCYNTDELENLNNNLFFTISLAESPSDPRVNITTNCFLSQKIVADVLCDLTSANIGLDPKNRLHIKVALK